MVLQRDVNVPIWGTAASGENVTVRFRDQVKSTTADAQGKWKVSLDPLQVGWPTPLEVGVPADLTVTGSNILTLVNVLVGEVWLGSGQSNMFGPAEEYVKKDEVKDEVLAKMVAIRPMAQCGEFCDEIVLTCQKTPFSPPSGPATRSPNGLHPQKQIPSSSEAETPIDH